MMHSISVIVGSTAWALMFRTEEKARSANALLQSVAMSQQSYAAVVDDFGQELAVTPQGLHGFMYEDMEQSKAAYCERLLHQQRMQIQAQRMADSDQMIRSHRAMSGPAIIDPVNGGRPRF